MDRHALEHWTEDAAEHADEVPHRQRHHGARRVVRMVLGELADLESQCLMAVHHTLGVAGGPRRERDQCRTRRVGVGRALHRFVVEQVVEVDAHARNDRNVGAQIRLILHPAELLGGDEHLRPGGGQDVTEFLAPVEVHHRHDDRAEQRRSPECRRRLHPVRQLERDDVPLAHAPRSEAGREPPRHVLDRAEGAGVRPRSRVHPKGDVGAGLQCRGQQIAECVRCPPALGFVSCPQRRGHGAAGGVKHSAHSRTGFSLKQGCNY